MIFKSPQFPSFFSFAPSFPGHPLFFFSLFPFFSRPWGVKDPIHVLPKNLSKALTQGREGRSHFFLPSFFLLRDDGFTSLLFPSSPLLPFTLCNGPRTRFIQPQQFCRHFRGTSPVSFFVSALKACSFLFHLPLVSKS